MDLGPATDLTSRTAAYVRDDNELHDELNILTQGSSLIVPIENLERFVAAVLQVADEVAEDYMVVGGPDSDPETTKSLRVSLRLISVENSIQLMRLIYERRILRWVHVRDVDKSLEAITLAVRNARDLL